MWQTLHRMLVLSVPSSRLFVCEMKSTIHLAGMPSKAAQITLRVDKVISCICASLVSRRYCEHYHMDIGQGAARRATGQFGDIMMSLPTLVSHPITSTSPLHPSFTGYEPPTWRSHKKKKRSIKIHKNKIAKEAFFFLDHDQQWGCQRC